MGASSTIYLDHAAAVPVLPEVLRAHEELCQTHFANPHATSALSNKSRFAVERAGCRLLELLSIPEGAAQVVWTSGGTEALNLGVLGFLRAGGGTGACLLDPLAHPAVSNPGAHFARDGGTTAELRLRGTELGREIPDGVLPEPVRLVAVTQVNNEIGLEYDLPGLRDWMRHHTPQAALLVDAIQSFGKLDVPWHEADIALLGISGRKIGGPASVGALVIRRGVRLEPLLYGGGQQEGLRPGTVDVVGVLEFVLAAEVACGRRHPILENVKALNRQLRRDLTALPNTDVVFVSPPEASPYILSVSFPGFEGAVLMRSLAERGIIVATGSACSAEAGKPSRVLTRIGLREHISRGVLRISFSHNTTQAELAGLVAELSDVLGSY